MKKRSGSRRAFTPREDRPDIAELIFKMQAQLTSLANKIDALIGRSAEKPFEKKEYPKPFQRFDHPRPQGGPRQENNYRERILHKAICADCNKGCEVPFKPSQDRPVYCKDCFSKRKGALPFGGRGDNRPHETGPAVQVSHGDKARGDEKKKFFGKKKPPAKRRKARD